MRYLSSLILLMVLVVAQAQPQSSQTPASAEAAFERRVRLLIEQRRYDEAIVACEQAIRDDKSLLVAYPLKWDAMLKQPDFEAQADLIRSEIESLLAGNKSERALSVAATGYELLADDDGLRKVQDRVLAGFPLSNLAREIRVSRAFAERDDRKRADLLEAFIARYPEDARAALIYADLFRTRATQVSTAAPQLNALGLAWIRHAGPSAYEMMTARVKVAMVMAERRTNLREAEVIALEAAKLAATLTVDSPLIANEMPKNRAAQIARLKEDAQMALGFVHLREGRATKAATELSETLKPVITQVERDRVVFWRDADLREFGLRPRVLWLAELYEAQGDDRQAAKALLAAVSDDEGDTRMIQPRLAKIYKRLNLDEARADADFGQALRQYRTLTMPTEATREALRQRVLAERAATPAPNFEALTLDKRPVSLANFQGKVGVLIFWATWCGPCVEEIPQFDKVVKRYSNNPDVVFLAISIDDRKMAVRPFWERRGYRMPVAYDGSGAAAFAIPGVPSLLILDRQGRVAFRELGYDGNGDGYVERLGWRIDELLKESEVTER